MIGTSCSSAALGVADTILSDRGISIISPSNTGPALTDPAQHQEFYLRTAHNDLIQGAAVANFAIEQGITSAATIHDGSPYADGLQQAFADVFSTGGTITKQEAIQVGDTDFNSVLTDIAADSPEMLYFPIFVAEGGLITQQARAHPRDGRHRARRLRRDVHPGLDHRSRRRERRRRVHLRPGPDGAGRPGVLQPDSSFRSTRSGLGPSRIRCSTPTPSMPPTWCSPAIEEVAIEEDGTLFIPRTALKDALYGVEGYQGVTGTLTCDDNGDCQSTATMAIVVVEDGEFSSRAGLQPDDQPGRRPGRRLTHIR